MKGHKTERYRKDGVVYFKCYKIGHMSSDCDRESDIRYRRFGPEVKVCRTSERNIRKYDWCRQWGHFNNKCWRKRNERSVAE